ncbi:39S ribosomal protein L33, mitochondrial isoform X2 [Zalophus californianus]|uniref:Large ribosomal subunit protein bL33m n=1 Tax=Zalophus californianus TaxID=9704 RepID=A0A6J2FIW9_ZALCA|nr:39S ribosomal protein L33, mitochondrial isoform X2 [Zalophus californianus]
MRKWLEKGSDLPKSVQLGWEGSVWLPKAALFPAPGQLLVAKSKSKTILVKMLSQAGTGYSFNTKRSRLREKLTLLHYDPIVKAKVLFVEQKKIRSL